jgi:hypothetical protein
MFIPKQRFINILESVKAGEINVSDAYDKLENIIYDAREDDRRWDSFKPGDMKG